MHDAQDVAKGVGTWITETGAAPLAGPCWLGPWGSLVVAIETLARSGWKQAGKEPCPSKRL